MSQSDNQKTNTSTSKPENTGPISYFLDPDNKDLQFTSAQVAYILKYYKPETQCYHLHVKVHSQLYRCATLEDPEEYEHKAHCLDCDEWLDVEDIPEEADGLSDL